MIAARCDQKDAGAPEISLSHSCTGLGIAENLLGDRCDVAERPLWVAFNMTCFRSFPEPSRDTLKIGRGRGHSSLPLPTQPFSYEGADKTICTRKRQLI